MVFTDCKKYLITAEQLMFVLRSGLGVAVRLTQLCSVCFTKSYWRNMLHFPWNIEGNKQIQLKMILCRMCFHSGRMSLQRIATVTNSFHSLLTHGPLVAIRKARQKMRASPKQCAVELRELLCQPNGSPHWPESSSQSWVMQQKAYSADSDDVY